MRRNSTLDIYITEVCNLNCEYCYVDLKKKEYDGFKYSEFTKRVNLLDFDFIKFLGWEPLLKYNEIKKIINSVLLKNKDIKFSIISNWILLDSVKLDFFRNNNTSVTISLHKSWLKNILDKSFLLNLLKYREIIWFVILYDYKDVSFWTKLFRLLVKSWFRNFSLTPIADINWNNKNIEKLRKELDLVNEIISFNKYIKISEANNLYLKNLNSSDFCKKTQIDKDYNFRLCTRFDKEDFLKDSKNIDYIHDLYNKNNSCNTCKDRWFCTCPIGWYLDNKWLETDDNLSKIFHNLNILFINFYKDIVKIKNSNNFLTSWINEIRFNLTEQCNLRCDYCYLDFKNKSLDILEAKNIIDFLLSQDWNNKIISFFWWEPLLEFDILKELVEYSNLKSLELSKNIFYKIATNWLLFNKEILDFLKKNNFEIHLSINWTKYIHNKTRDNSFSKIEEKISLFNDYENIVVLMVIFPNHIFSLEESIKQIKTFWFSKLSFEIYLWNKYNREMKDYKNLETEISRLKNLSYFDDIELLNLSNNSEKYLDISTDWKVNDNSLEFFENKIDFTPKKEFDKIINKLFK